MIQNLRDLGGLKTSDGRTIKKGCFVRSANLSEAEKSDILNIATVIDLRTDKEREEAPDQSFDAEYLAMPIFNEMTAGISHEIGSESQGLPDMKKLYAWLVKDHKEEFKKVLETIMNHNFSKGAILWHCTEGKDRCGLTTALILEMLGVNREIILEDYLKTNEVNLPKAKAMREQVKKVRGEVFAESIYQIYIADESYLQSAWNVMGDNYLEEIGITKEKMESFKNQVLE